MSVVMGSMKGHQGLSKKKIRAIFLACANGYRDDLGLPRNTPVVFFLESGNSLAKDQFRASKFTCFRRLTSAADRVHAICDVLNQTPTLTAVFCPFDADRSIVPAAAEAVRAGQTAYVVVTDTDFVMDSAVAIGDLPKDTLSRLHFVDSHGVYHVLHPQKLAVLGACYDITFGDPAHGHYRLHKNVHDLFQLSSKFNNVIFYFLILINKQILKDARLHYRCMMFSLMKPIRLVFLCDLPGI